MLEFYISGEKQHTTSKKLMFRFQTQKEVLPKNGTISIVLKYNQIQAYLRGHTSKSF